MYNAYQCWIDPSRFRANLRLTEANAELDKKQGRSRIRLANSLSGVSVLLAKLGVQLLPSEISGMNYRNNDAALSLLQHVAF